MNLTPMWRKVAIAPLVHCTTLVFNEPPRSNFACLPGKRAFRLGCAALSAPPHTLCAAVQREKILSSPQKQKGSPLRTAIFGGGSEPYSLRAAKPAALALRAMLRPLRNPRGATLLASLTSKLVDSATLRYLRLSLRSTAQRWANPFFSAKAKRQPFKDCHFWRRRKDLNLRAGCPTYTLSRGASSPLEYFSI